MHRPLFSRLHYSSLRERKRTLPFPVLAHKRRLKIRSKVPDSAFLIDFSKALKHNRGSFKEQFGNLNTFPVGGADVQLSISRIQVESGGNFPSHSHPRATEVIYVRKGVVRTKLRFEALPFAKPRIVTNIVKASQVSVFPQGLAHEVTCISKYPCTYIAFFNSADAGGTVAPSFCS